MLELSFPQLNIVETTSGNLITIMNRFQDNINVVIAGTDRVAGYDEAKNEAPYEADISASKVIKNILDDVYFYKKHQFQFISHMSYDTMKSTYKEN